MTYSPALILHIFSGTVAVVAGFIALLTQKGSRVHRRSGDVFVASMMLMASSGAAMAFRKEQAINVIAGCWTFYLVSTAWLALMKRGQKIRLLEIGLLLFALAAGAGSLHCAVEAATSATGLKAGVRASGYLVFLTLILLAALGDLRFILRRSVNTAQRLVRHVWRMGFALFIAVGSLFLGTASDPVLRRTGLRATTFTPAIRRTHLPEVPVAIVVIVTLFWLFRLLFTQKRPNAPAQAS